jgi:hypothetical protein
VLSIDDGANQATYGEGTTPRMIFENRAMQAPSTDVVALRDQLEEATAQARSNRGTGGTVTVGAASPVTATTPAGTTPATTTTPASTTSASAPVVPVEDAPARTESLPPTPDPRIGTHQAARSSSGGSHIRCGILFAPFPREASTWVVSVCGTG